LAHLLTGGKCRTRFGNIRERAAHAGDFLIRFVPLAGKQNHIGRMRSKNRPANGLGAINDELGAWRRYANFGENRCRFLAARVIAGQHDTVGPLHGDCAHQRSLAAITITAAAEYGDQTGTARHGDGAQSTQ
jgi:hypothetical protein